MHGGPNNGELKGSYRLLRVVGRGGMGIVYEAWDTRLDRRVALKLLHPQLLTDPARQRAFEREARIAARVEHPNVVRIYRIDQVDGQSAIEMQFIDGQPLSALLRSGRLTPGQAIDVLEQVLEALACCHEQGLVHCDLKPGNLLVTPDGRVHLTDFGIARALSMQDDADASPQSEPLSGPLWGTPRYSPPEAWDGGVPTPQWDLYAAGVLFYELLTGEPLLQGSTPASLLKQILTGPPPRLSDILPDVSSELSVLVADLVARDPAQRPASARVVLERLAALPEYPKGSDDTCRLPVQRMDFSAPPPEPTPVTPVSSGTFSASLRGRRRLATLAIACALLGVLALMLAFPFWPRPGLGGPLRPAAPPGTDSLTVANGAAYFSAYDGAHGRELYCYDSEHSAAKMVADLAPGPGSSNPRRLIVQSQGNLLFAASTPESGEELWFCTEVTGGNRAVRMVKDIIPGPMGSEPEPVVTHENLVFFYATTLQAGRELWCTNSIEAQTAMVADIFPGQQGSYPGGARVASDENGFYFVALADAARGAMVFRYDYATGTLREAVDVPDDTAAMVVFKDRLFFTQTDPAHGAELWVHDPAASTTELFLDLWPGMQSSAPGQFFVWRDRLFFQARTEQHGLELWSSDGTPVGTALLANLNPGPADSDPYGFVDGGEHVFFRAKDAAHGQEPWVSDGTPEGTRLLADVRPGPEGSIPYNMSPQPGRLFFSADDGLHGEELWAAERAGSDWQTRLVADLMPGPGKSEPHDLRWRTEGVGAFMATLPGRGACLCELSLGPGQSYSVTPVMSLQRP